jgi:hypothetical protein
MNFDAARQRFETTDEDLSQKVDPTDRYVKSYPLLLKSTAHLCDAMGSNAVPGVAQIVYGWMPTILQNLTFDDHINDHLIAARQINDFQSAFNLVDGLETSPINNSWVGLSKVLHFINPEFFPIWDSVVAKHFGVSNHKIKQKKIYTKYMKFISENLEFKSVSTVQDLFEKRANYTISKVRACEFILFTAPKNK